MKLSPDGRLAVSEREVERHRRDFLELRGWTVIETRAEARKQNGAAAHLAGTLDWLCVRPRKAVEWRLALWRPEQVLVIENKARLARTKKSRRAQQAATEASWQAKGFGCYRDKDGDPDPIGSFEKWYRQRFEE
jgi:hypothetical protein